MRLCLYSLIKILNRQHIILKVQRILAYAHHLVGIHLCYYAKRGSKCYIYDEYDSLHYVYKVSQYSSIYNIK